LIFAIRICAFSLGENDIRDLRLIVEKFPERKLAFLDVGRNIWHEVGLLSVAIGKPALRLYSQSEAQQALKKGAILVLSSEQEGLLSSKDFPDIKETYWWRLKRNFAVPSLTDLEQVGDQKNQRKFTMIFLQ
jgi:hypothetical protein